ncbi:hypothetical protein [Bradyrhizobium japonicum]|uniref:hypothetical protein n=1 Tax=Bradyrhizobium japonicum TaxID=375 RepID=UPI002714C4B6|nr:hypothetical protein [Bradyrhizobium japonicum]WLB58115.1 hypothetical protein QIH94_19650 [Bradyrhizobium japonicum]
MSDAKQRTAKPGDLLSQWWTLGAIAADRRTAGRHMKAGWVIINSYWQKHGNGRASLSYIQKATGLDRKAAVKACRELVAWGHVTRVKYPGTRPSEYVPRWVTTASGVQTATTKTDAPSGGEMTTTLVVESTPLEGASGVQMTTESYLRSPAYKPDLQIGRDDTCPPAAPPLADGLAATAAGGTAVEERARSHADDIQAAQAKLTFELCYRTYDYAKGKKEARAAWDALPAEVDRAAVIKAAAAWQASWEAQGKPDAPRKHLATWLREERYDEDAPTGYQPKEKAKAKSGPQKSANPAEPVSQKSDARVTAKPAKRQPAAPITARVTASEVVKVEGLSELRFTATDEAGVEHEHVITLEHPDMETQFEGQRQLAKLVHAAGLEQIQDSSELHDRTIVITENGFAEPDTRPDDEPPIAVKPEPVKYANPPSEPWTEADQARVKQWVASLPSVRSRYRTSDECRAQLDAEADEEFQRDAANDDWPAWMDDEYERDDEAA